MVIKSELTQRLITEFNLNESLDVALNTWYQNIRPTGGLRLTDRGYRILKNLSIEYWAWAWPDRSYVDKRLLLDMDRKLTYPYYIDTKNKEIVFFSSKEAMLATLYGDLKSFLKQC